jgi:hypothetical protein
MNVVELNAVPPITAYGARNKLIDVAVPAAVVARPATGVETPATTLTDADTVNVVLLGTVATTYAVSADSPVGNVPPTGSK